MKAETLVKVIVIFFMIIFMIILGITALMILKGHYDQRIMILHLTTGVLFLTILLIHIYLRREKLKKLIKEFFSILTAGTLKQTCENHAYLKTFKQRSLQEICNILDIDIDRMTEFLHQKQLTISGINDSLEKISIENKNDPLKIFAMIVENKIRIQKENNV